MSETRAVRMHRVDATSLSRLRQQSNVEVCECQDMLWLRAKHITDELDAAMRTLPGTRFAILPDGQLMQFGTRVPKGYSPDGAWISLKKWLTVQAESAAYSGKITAPIQLRLVRGGPLSDSNVIVTPLATWRQYVRRAPQIRLDQSVFAMNAAGQVVVRGTPLPPIKGARYVERSGVAIEAGWTWVPAVDPQVVAEMLELAAGDCALLHADGSWDHIRVDDFVRTTRSAVRLSAESA